MSSMEELFYNAKLQQKKSGLRKNLSERGVLKRGGVNEYDKYKYFSEAQYKELFTELLSFYGLELSFTEIDYEMFVAEGKQSNGRLVKVKFTLTDIETGFSESSVITGEGMDKGDKAGYKAYTGAMKYYLANTFLVATGDDPEKESPVTEPINSAKDVPATDEQIRIIKESIGDDAGRMAKLLEYYNVNSLDELNVVQASQAVKRVKK